MIVFLFFPALVLLHCSSSGCHGYCRASGSLFLGICSYRCAHRLPVSIVGLVRVRVVVVVAAAAVAIVAIVIF